jgi:hypothetical protein
MGSRIGRRDSAAMVTHKQTGQIEIEIEKTQQQRLREPDGELNNNNSPKLYHTDRAAAESPESREQRHQLLQFRDRRWLLRQVHNLQRNYHEKPARF